MSTATARRLLAATLTILAVLVLAPGSIGARTREGAPHGCGVLVDSAHPWHSHVPGSHTETGDHWVTARNGPLSTCAFTKLTIHRLLALPTRIYQADNAGHLLGGGCDWDHGSGHETIRPFAEIVCHLPTPRHPHIAAATVIALVDPDPHSSTERHATRSRHPTAKANDKPRTHVTHLAASPLSRRHKSRGTLLSRGVAPLTDQREDTQCKT